MNNQEVYLLDFGVLVSMTEEDVGYYAYTYDGKYMYFDEWMGYSINFKDSIEAAKKYVADGVDNTYAVISITSRNFKDTNIEEIEHSAIFGEDYSLAGVQYSIAKINGEIVESFINKEATDDI